MTFTNLLQIFTKKANQFNIQTQIEASHICEISRRILKEKHPHMWEDCTVNSYSKGTLTLGALNSNAAQELFFLKKKLLEEINTKFQQKIIKKVNIHHQNQKKEDNYYS